MEINQIITLLISTIIPGILSNAKLLPLKKIASNLIYFIYFFIAVALSEEISFRGFIQPRLYPLVKREWLAVLFGGLLYVFMHYPYQMEVRGMTAAQYWPNSLSARHSSYFGTFFLQRCTVYTEIYTEARRFMALWI